MAWGSNSKRKRAKARNPRVNVNVLLASSKSNFEDIHANSIEPNRIDQSLLIRRRIHCPIRPSLSVNQVLVDTLEPPQSFPRKERLPQSYFTLQYHISINPPNRPTLFLRLRPAQEAEGQPDGQGQGPQCDEDGVDDEAREDEEGEALPPPPGIFFICGLDGLIN